MTWGAWSLPRFAVLNLVFLQTWDGVLGESLELPKEEKPLVVWDGECEIALEPMTGNWASSRIDLEYTELFRFAVVNSRTL